MATDHNFRIKNGLEVGGQLIVTSSGQLAVASVSSQLQFLDNVKAKFGNGSDLQLYHDATDSYITNSTGILNIASDTIHLERGDGSEVYLTAFANGSVYLYHNNNAKLQTTSTGVSVTGDLAVSGDLNITGDINSVSVTDLDVVDKTITVGQGQSASNSTGSGLVVAGANANMLWDNSDDRWEFNKDIFTSGKIDLGNVQMYASGDNNHLHINAPTAIIGPSTTTASNPSLGTSSYRFDGVYSSVGSFSGDMTIAGTTLINGAHDNSGKADFAVDGGTQISLYDGQVQMGGTDMNWASKFFHDSSGGHVAVWDNNLEFFTQGSNTGSATARDIIFSPQISGTATPTERVRIKGDGNVGIGTSTPSEILHVKGTNGAIAIDGNGSSNTASIKFINDNERSRITSAYDSGGGGRLTFHTDTTGGSLVERMRIDNAGRVGIGTTSPSQLLHLRMPNLAGGNNGDGLFIADDGAQLKLEIRKGTGGVNADRRIALYEDGGNFPLYLQEEGGNVGIGKFQTTQSNANGYQSLTPQSLLHLMSHGMVGSGTDVMLTLESYISDYSATPKLIAIDFKGQDSNNNTNFARIAQATVNDTDYGENNEATSNIIFGMTQSGTYNERVIMTGAGKVGIGTLNPTYQLDMQGSTASARIRKTANDATVIIESSTAGAWTTYRSPNYYAGALYVINGTEQWAAGILQGVDRWTVRRGRSGTEFFTITNTGNIGINTGSPDAKFQIEHNGGHTSGNIAISHSMFDLYNPLEANTDEKGSILTFSDNYFDGTNYIRTTRAAIKGGTDTTGNTADGFLAFYTDSTSANSATERMRITKDGRVGIGTNNPIQALQAVGSIYANGGNVFVDSGQKFIWGNSQQWIQASNSASMFFATNGQNRLELQTDGDLIVSGDIFMGDEHIDFKTNGSSILPQLRGHRSNTDLDSRNFTTEGGFSYTTFESSSSNKPSHVSNNANGVITLNTHTGSYNHQLAFTNKGNIAQRSRDGGSYTSWYNILTDRAPNNPAITSTTTVNETIEIVFAASTSSDHVAATSYEVWSDGGTGSDYSLIAKIPYNDIASSMSVVDSSFDDSGTIAYRIYAIKNGVYSTASTTTHSFSMPSLDVSDMSVVPDTNSYHIQYNLPDTRFLDHVEIYVDAEASNSNLSRSGASLIYSGSNTSFVYNISSSDMEKYHQFWVECVSV